MTNQQAIDSGLSEADWKEAFKKMLPVEQTFLFGLYTGRS